MDQTILEFFSQCQILQRKWCGLGLLSARVSERYGAGERILSQSSLRYNFFIKVKHAINAIDKELEKKSELFQ